MSERVVFVSLRGAASEEALIVSTCLSSNEKTDIRN